MSNSKFLIELAAGLIAGNYTEEALSEMLNDDQLSSVLSLASSIGAGTVSAIATNAILDTEIGRDICDTSDDIIDTIGDAASSLNPFSDW